MANYIAQKILVKEDQRVHWDEEERSIFWAREQYMQRPRGRVYWRAG